ncbi:MAG: PrgI family protein, partial [Candidatus Pacebacteria bacterium]|nr:PrgI family protein [Candidatus Paceibacterota bacterium]
MQFQVPQFIEVEDKIFGPFTFKQFVYIAGGLGLAYLLWRLLPTFVAAPLVIGVMGFAVALAFMQYNGRPFMVALESAF